MFAPLPKPFADKRSRSPELLPSNDSTIETPAQTVPAMLKSNLSVCLKLGRRDESGDGLDVWQSQCGSDDREPLAVRVAMGGDEGEQTVSCLGNSTVARTGEARVLATDVSHRRICLPFGVVPRSRSMVDQEHFVLWILQMVEVVQQLAYPGNGIVEAHDHANRGEPNKLGFSIARQGPKYRLDTLPAELVVEGACHGLNREDRGPRAVAIHPSDGAAMVSHEDADRVVPVHSERRDSLREFEISDFCRHTMIQETAWLSTRSCATVLQR